MSSRQVAEKSLGLEPLGGKACRSASFLLSVLIQLHEVSFYFSCFPPAILYHLYHIGGLQKVCPCLVRMMIIN